MTEALTQAHDTARPAQDADPITTEVVRHGLDAAADQMRATLKRTAFSPIIYEMTDLAGALYDTRGRLLAQARALPMFLGTLSFSLEAAVKTVGGAEALEPGDVIFSTYGYDIGAHPQDSVVIIPGFLDGELVGYAVVKAHQLDIGAKGLYCTDTVDVFQEGVIFPNVRVYRRGELQEDMYRTILANSRFPKALAGDLAAEISAARVGLEGLYRVIDRCGRARFERAVDHMMDHAEQEIRQGISTIPDGRYSAEGALDNDGISDDLVPFGVTVEVEGSEVTVDFSTAPPQLAGPLNSPLPATVSAARLAIMTLLGGTESANEGHFRPIGVRTVPGTMFHPVAPAPIFLYAWPAFQAADLVHRALAEALPDAVPAGSGGDLGAIMWWGEDENGEPWADGTDHCVGQGATAAGDGSPPMIHISFSGMRSTPAEVFEARRPALLERYEYASDSGGAGRHRGGPAIDVHYRVLRDVWLTMAWDRMKTPPWGLFGGKPGRPNAYRIRYPDGSRSAVIYKITGLKVPTGSVLELSMGGGGGYGPPAERDVAAIERDLVNGYVTEAAARAEYPHAFPD